MITDPMHQMFGQKAGNEFKIQFRNGYTLKLSHSLYDNHDIEITIINPNAETIQINDEDMELANKYTIRGVPTLVFLEDGVEVTRTSGVFMADKIEEFVHD